MPAPTAELRADDHRSAPAWDEGPLDSPVPLVDSPGDVSLPWTFIALSPGGRRLRIAYVAGSKYRVTFDGFLVVEPSSSINAHSHRPICLDATALRAPAMLPEGAGTSTASSPLGTRARFHPAVNERWAAPTPDLDR